MKGKTVSKWAIVFASFWIIVNAIMRAVFPLFGAEYGLTMKEIIASGITLVIVWTPVYRSVWLDKRIDKQCEL